MNNCGISRWDDPNEINARLKALTSQPIWEVTDEYYNNVILKYFDEKCKASKAVYEESKEYIPGGVQHNLAFNKPFPMCMARADGAYLYDKDGNQYIDFLQAGGPTILGSNYPVIREKVIELLNECGPVTGLLHESELMIAKEINRHMPNVEMFRMLGSGTESVMAALRIARIATGKKRIIKVGGAYHGWSDQMVYGLKIPGSRALLESHGIPGGCYEATDEVRPNDLTMLEDMLKRNVLLGGTAGVIVEPVGPESGTRPVAHDYNAGVRTLCDKYGALMIFDEVVTGFRVALSGAQGYFGVVPDLTVFGKIVAGGYPAAGGVGGKKEYAQLMAGELDTQLVYRKRLRRPLSEYQRNVPPHVRAARLADEENQKRGRPLQYQNRGTIKYVWTTNGPEPLDYQRSPLDYEHYLTRQLQPVAEGILPFIEDNFATLMTGQLGLF